MIAASFVALLLAAPLHAVDIENDYLKAVIDVDKGGRVVSLIDKATGAEFTIDSDETAGGDGMLFDRLWGERQHRYFERSAYEVVGISDNSVTLRIAMRKNEAAFLIDKTIAAPPDRASLVVDYAVSNIGAAPWEGRLWIGSVMGPPVPRDQPWTLHAPTGYFDHDANRATAELGRRQFTYTPDAPRDNNNLWTLDPFAGWAAVTGAGRGIVVTADRGYLHAIYNYQPPGVAGGEKLATTELFFGPLLLRPTDDDALRDKLGIAPLVGQAKPGVPFRTRLVLTPFSQVGDEMLGAHDGLIVGATRTGAAVRLTAVSDRARTLDAGVTGGATWKADLQPGQPASQTFDLSADAKVLTVTLADGYAMTLPRFDDPDDALSYNEQPSVARKTDFQPQIDFPEIDAGPSTAHVAWMKPLPRKPRVLLFVADRARRDVPELKQRLDAEIDTVVVAHPHYFTYKSSPIGTDPRRVLSHYLEKDYDAIVIGGGLYWGTLPEDARARIVEKIEAGTGLLYITPHAGDRLFSNSAYGGVQADVLYDAPVIDGAAAPIARGVPQRNIPIFQDWDTIADRIIVRQMGKGRVIEYDAPVWPYGAPYMVRQTLRPFVPREAQDGVEFDFDEYHWLLTLKLIAEAAGVAPPVAMNVRLTGDLEMMLDLVGGKGQAVITVTYRDRFGRAIDETETPVTLPTPVLRMARPEARALPGVVTADVIVRDGEGRVIGVGAGETVVHSDTRIASLRTAKFGHEVDEPIAVEAHVTGGATLAFTVTDMHNRVIARHTAPVAQRTAAASADNGDLVPNGSFELDAAGAAKTPTGWVRAMKDAQIVNIAEGARPGGDGARTLHIAGNADAPGGGVMSGYLPVDPAHPLEVSAWVRSDGESVAGPGAYLGVHWYDRDRKPIPISDSGGKNYVYALSAVRPGTWTRFQRTYHVAGEGVRSQDAVPAGAAFFELRAFTLEYPGSVWFDDIEATQPQQTVSDTISQKKVSDTVFVRFTLATRTGLTQLRRIEAELRDADGSLFDAAWCEYTVDLPKKQDVTFQVWGPNCRPGTTSGDLELDVIAQTGFDYATVGAGNTPPHEVRAYGLALMRRGLRFMPMTLMGIHADRTSIGTDVRQPCLTDPAFRRHQARHLASYTDLIHELYPPAYYNGDENSLGSYSRPHDFCQSPSCLQRFRGWLEEKYRSVGSLNAEWGTDFASFDDVRPFTLAEARDNDHWTPWIEHRAYMPSVLAACYRNIQLLVKTGRPSAAFATSGMGRPSLNNGFDWPQLLPTLDHGSLYARQHSHKYRMVLYQSFINPGATFGTWTGYGASQRFVRDSFWWELLSGFTCPAYYASLEYLCTPAFAQTDDADALARDIAEMRSGIGKIIFDASRQNDRVAMLHSYLSAVAIESIKQRTGEGVDFDDYYFALDGYTHILHELGYQYRMVDRTQLHDGKVTRADYDVLIMPMAHALSDEEVAAAQRFVAEGGTLVVDPAFGYLRDSGKPAHRAALAAWMGVDGQDQRFLWSGERSATVTLHGSGQVVTMYQPVWDYPRLRADGRGRLMREQVADVMRAAPPFARIDAGGDIGGAFWNGEITRHAIGSGCIVSLRRSAAVWPDGALASPDLTLAWDTPQHVYDVRTKQYLGELTAWSGELDLGDLTMLALLPETIGPMSASVAGGAKVVITARVDTPQRTAVHLDVYDPAGKKIAWYGGNAPVVDGAAVFTVPHALDDAAGTWRAEVREVISGQTTQVTWER